MVTNEEHMTSIEVSDIGTTLKVGAEYLKGKNTTEIAGSVAMKRGEVEKHIRAYKELMKETAKTNVQLADRLQVTLEETLHHYDVITKAAWDNKDEAEMTGDIKSVNTALRLIADLQKTKFQFVESVTEGQDAELLAELEQAERQHELLKGILLGLKERFPEAFKYVRNEMSSSMEDVEVIDPV